MIEHADVSGTNPRNRYSHDHQWYKFDEETEVVVECGQDTMWLCTIAELGISAGFVYVDDSPIGIEGEIRVPATKVEHRPTEGKRGLIEIHTE